MDIQQAIVKWAPEPGSPLAVVAAQHEALEGEADRLTALLDRRQSELAEIDARAAGISFESDLREMAIDRWVRPVVVEQIDGLRREIFRRNDAAGGLMRRIGEMIADLEATAAGDDADYNMKFAKARYLLPPLPRGRR